MIGFTARRSKNFLFVLTLVLLICAGVVGFYLFSVLRDFKRSGSTAQGELFPYVYFYDESFPVADLGDYERFQLNNIYLKDSHSTDDGLSLTFVPQLNSDTELTIEARGQISVIVDDKSFPMFLDDFNRVFSELTLVSVGIIYLPPESSLTNVKLRDYRIENFSSEPDLLERSLANLGHFGEKRISKEEVKKILKKKEIALDSGTFLLYQIVKD